MKPETAYRYAYLLSIVLALVGLLSIGIGTGYFLSIGIVETGCKLDANSYLPKCIEQIKTLNRNALCAIGTGVASMLIGGLMQWYLKKQP